MNKVLKKSQGLSSIPKLLAVFIFILTLAACSTTHPKTNTTRRSHDILLPDSTINKYKVKFLLDDNFWTTSNLQLNIPDSYCYNDLEVNCQKYGRLYTWEAAQKVCTFLGEGWRLPTNNEWTKLAALYGAVPTDSVENRKRAYQALMNTGTSSFNAVLGGGRNLEGEYGRVDAHGFYWTATESNSTMACFANFGKGSNSLYHQTEADKTDAFSVRCIKSNHPAK